MASCATSHNTNARFSGRKPAKRMTNGIVEHLVRGRHETRQPSSAIGCPFRSAKVPRFGLELFGARQVDQGRIRRRVMARDCGLRLGDRRTMQFAAKRRKETVLLILIFRASTPPAALGGRRYAARQCPPITQNGSGASLRLGIWLQCANATMRTSGVIVDLPDRSCGKYL